MKFYKLFADGKKEINTKDSLSKLQPSNNFSDLINPLRKSQEYLKTVKTYDIISWLDEVCEKWSERDSKIQKKMNNMGINYLIFWLKKKNLLKLANLALRGKIEFLDNFYKINKETKLMAHPRGIVSHWISGNVPVLGLLSIIQGIITKNANIVKLPKDNLNFIPTLLQSMSKINYKNSSGQLIEGNKIVKSILCVYYPSSNKKVLNEMSLQSQVRVAWGGTNAVETIMHLPRKFGCEDIIFGPKTSFAVVGKEKLKNNNLSKNIAKKISFDASQFEQQGCNSPHTIFVEKKGNISPLKFAEQLSVEMNKLSKKVFRDPNTTVDIGQILTLRAKYDMMDKAFYSSDLNWTVLYSENDKGLAKPCYFKTVFVRPIDDVMKIDKYCSHFTQTAGVALSDERKIEFAKRVSAKGIDRVPEVGSMLNYDIPWDGIFMMDRLVRWCKI